jgi:hypothetical protein
MHVSAFDSSIWATGLIGQAVLLLVLLYRHRANSFPIFTTMVALSFAGSCGLYFVYSHWGHRAYYFAYWAYGTVDMMIQLAVVYEIASHLFAPLGTWAPDVRKSFIRLVSGSIFIASILTALASPVRSSFMETVIARGTFFSSALMTELFVGLVALSAVAGLPWGTHVARVAQAQGAYSLICVILDTSTSWLGWAHEANTIHTLSQVRIVAYLGVLAYWIIMLWQEAPEPRQMPDSMRMQIFHLQRQVEYDLGRIRGWRKI